MKKLLSVNKHLGELICCSCRSHNSFSTYDKVFLLPDECEIRVKSDGSLEFYNQSDHNSDIGRKLLQEAAEINPSDYKTCGEGISVALQNVRLECASCGDEAFLIPKQ